MPRRAAQALECLASAVYYEAGNQDDDGERAVAQVVLNRVRHPAFPASVCGVVYEGSTRPTGCQFTFTCDGSLYRQPDADGWRRAYEGRRGGAVRLGLCAGRLGDPLSRRLCRSLLGLDAGQERHRRRAHLLSLGRRLGPAGGLHQGLCGPRAQRRRAAHRRARRAARDAVTLPSERRRRRSTRSPAPKRSSSRRRCAATSASRSASTSSPARRPTRRAHEDYAKKFEASDNLKWCAVGRDRSPITSSRSASRCRPQRGAPAGAAIASAQR